MNRTPGIKKQFLTIAIPMILQNLITNFVSMLDNIMIGRVGTAEMSGVSIANQLIFVFNVTVFGGVSGASIFGTQFFGKGDHEGQKYTFRFRLLTVAVLVGLFAIIFSVFGTNLISLFLNGDDDPALIADTLKSGKQYLDIMIVSLIPFGISQAYSSVIRETGETKVPMFGSLAAIFVNLIFDYGLIFGNLGMPKLGVEGAAIATLGAKIVEALVVVIWAHTHPAKNRYIVGLFKGFRIPRDLAKKIILKGLPLLFNEFLWSLGMSIIAQSYSVRGIDVVAARNIASTLTNLFSVVFIQMGGALGIVVGARLGAGELEKAIDIDKELMRFSILINTGIGLLLIPFAFVFPKIYNTTDEIRALATSYIIIQALAMPIWTYTNNAYFTLRCGGKTGITFLFDFVYTWFIMIPLAFVLSRYTNLEIHLLFIVVTYSEILKVVIGYFMIRSKIWVNNLVEKDF